MTAISRVTTDELLEICSRTGDSIIPCLDCIPNKGLKLAVKSNPDMFAEMFEVYKFPVTWERQKLVLLPKAR